MAIIQCPHCEGKMRFPDDSEPKKVKCPTCGESFMGKAPGSGTKDAPAAKATSRADDKDDRPAKKTAKKDDVEDDFDVVDDGKSSKKKRDDDDDDRPKSKRRDDDDDDRPKSKRRDDDDDDRPKSRRRDDDDEDRPKSKRRRDDDEDEDRPKSRRRDDDDDDDRPRSKKRRDDDDDDDRPAKKSDTKAQYRNAKTGLNLCGISLWCAVGGLSVQALLMILATLGTRTGDYLVAAGLPGLASTIVAGVGIGFLMAGPKKGNLFGLTLALTIVAGLHLVFLIVAISNVRRPGGDRWMSMVTTVQFLVLMLLNGDFDVMGMITALTEMAKYILMFLVWKELCTTSKRRDEAAKANMLIIGYPSAWGVVLVIMLIAKLIGNEAGGGEWRRYVFVLVLLMMFGAVIAVKAWGAMIAGEIRDAVRAPTPKK